MATYNIWNGNTNDLTIACRAMHLANIDIAILTETKIPDDIHTRQGEDEEPRHLFLALIFSNSLCVGTYKVLYQAAGREKAILDAHLK